MLFPVKQLVVVVVGHCCCFVAVVAVVGIAAGSLLKATQLIDRSGQASEHRLPHIRVKYLRTLRRYKCICDCGNVCALLFPVVCCLPLLLLPRLGRLLMSLGSCGCDVY